MQEQYFIIYLNYIEIEAYLRELCSRAERQTNNPIFHKAETFFDRLLVTEIYVIPNFVISPVAERFYSQNGRREVPGSIPGRVCRPGHSEFSVIFS